MRWTERPAEEARLLNPSFLAALVSAASRDFESQSGEAMPWSLAFVIPVLALTGSTRDSLPGTVGAHFSGWLQDHPEVRAGFPMRARSMVPLIREALRLGLRTGMLELDAGRLHAARHPTPRFETTDDVADCFRAARFFGRWFGRRHEPQTIFRLLGVTA
jgi:hypothetical protein